MERFRRAFLYVVLALALSVLWFALINHSFLNADHNVFKLVRVQEFPAHPLWTAEDDAMLISLVLADLQREAEAPRKLRAKALGELQDNAEYLSWCGVINAAFVGCAPSFSEEVLAHYTPYYYADAEGFGLVLLARGGQARRDADCQYLRFSSAEGLEIFDAGGKAHAQCALPMQVASETAAEDQSGPAAAAPES